MYVSRRHFLASVAQLGLLTACGTAPQGQPSSTSTANESPPPVKSPAIAPKSSAAPARARPAAAVASPSGKPVASVVASPSRVALITASPSPSATTVAGKPMYQMDPQHTGRSQHTGPKQLRLMRSIDLISPELRPPEQAVVNTPDIESSTVIGPDGTIYVTSVVVGPMPSKTVPRGVISWSWYGGSDRRKAARRPRAARRSPATAPPCTSATPSALR